MKIRSNIIHRMRGTMQRRKNLAKASSKKSAKSFLAKKSAKLPELSWAAAGLGHQTLLYSHSGHGKALFSQDIIRLWDNTLNFGLSAFIFPKAKSGVKIQKYDLRSAQSDDGPVDSVHAVGHSVPHHNQARKLDRVQHHPIWRCPDLLCICRFHRVPTLSPFLYA